MVTLAVTMTISHGRRSFPSAETLPLWTEAVAMNMEIGQQQVPNAAAGYEQTVWQLHCHADQSACSIHPCFSIAILQVRICAQWPSG